MEFLPPRLSRWNRVAGRLSTRRNLWASSAAAGLVLAVTLAFSLQYWRLTRLETGWRAMETKVQQLSTMQDRIRQYRSWFDKSFPTLFVVKGVTELFPEEGAVWAKTLEIKNASQVQCSGFARSRPALLDALKQLRDSPQVAEVSPPQVKGENPLQFSVDFRWREQGGGE